MDIIETPNGCDVKKAEYVPNAPLSKIQTMMDVLKEQHKNVITVTTLLSNNEFINKRSGIENALKKMDSDFDTIAEEFLYLRKMIMEIQKERDLLLDEYMKAKGYIPNQKKVRNMNKPTMYMTVGLPGCGKSTWAREQDLLIFSSDELRKKMPEADNNKIFQALHKQIKETLSNGQSCIFDATNLSRKHRRSLVEALNGVECTKTCVFFLMPVSVCMERNRGREGDARVPDEVYDRMLRSFNVPSLSYDGFDEILLHAYEADFELPDYEHLDDFSQDNPHHAESLGEHMKMAYEVVEKASKDSSDPAADLAKEAARWHDIGKVHTKDFHNSKDEASDEAHYYGHDNYGAYMYLLKWLKETPENERATTVMQALNVAEVINWHMAPHTVWQESKKRFKYDRERLDPDIVRAIDLVHEADKEAMIEEDLEKDERNW